MTDTTDLILDANFIPVDPGVVFHATFPNPLSERHRTFVTLADGQLLELTNDKNRVLSRAAFVKSRSSTAYHLDALRAKIAHHFPTREELRRLPRNEQYALLDQIEDHLNTADGMIDTAGEILREYRIADDGRRQWLTRGVHVNTFDLWDCNHTPVWDHEDTAPTWAPTMPAPPHSITAWTISSKDADS